MQNNNETNHEESFSDVPISLKDYIDVSGEFDVITPQDVPLLNVFSEEGQLLTPNVNSERAKILQKLYYLNENQLTEIIEENSELEVSQLSQRTKLPSLIKMLNKEGMTFENLNPEDISKIGSFGSKLLKTPRTMGKKRKIECSIINDKDIRITYSNERNISISIIEDKKNTKDRNEVKNESEFKLITGILNESTITINPRSMQRFNRMSKILSEKKGTDNFFRKKPLINVIEEREGVEEEVLERETVKETRNKMGTLKKAVLRKNTGPSKTKKIATLPNKLKSFSKGQGLKTLTKPVNQDLFKRRFSGSSQTPKQSMNNTFNKRKYSLYNSYKPSTKQAKKFKIELSKFSTSKSEAKKKEFVTKIDSSSDKKFQKIYDKLYDVIQGQKSSDMIKEFNTPKKELWKRKKSMFSKMKTFNKTFDKRRNTELKLDSLIGKKALNDFKPFSAKITPFSAKNHSNLNNFTDIYTNTFTKRLSSKTPFTGTSEYVNIYDKSTQSKSSVLKLSDTNRSCKNKKSLRIGKNINTNLFNKKRTSNKLLSNQKGLSHSHKSSKDTLYKNNSARRDVERMKEINNCFLSKFL